MNDTQEDKTVSPNSVQEFMEIEAWLLLTFLICFHSQLSSMHSIVTYLRVQIFEKFDSSSKRLPLSASFMAKFELVFVLTQKNTFS